MGGLKKSIQVSINELDQRERQLSCSSALPSARQKSVFAYPKQIATVLVGSVLK
jgi:hypothetical protein